eukprot:CAMPEP_0170109168 /NCGR_PEP_ID=MMETSP0020_2-20130122/7021_1 /TAXON_ID=98059 /ORGANISM="Dinobryon sp., Strain UTEXLB2267" /LENGTH=111 /DNA_ID=CAMNT_0010334059 /DNA_START=102 /DNA_END=437 /DNA_ORIENTATION=-
MSRWPLPDAAISAVRLSQSRTSTGIGDVLLVRKPLTAARSFSAAELMTTHGSDVVLRGELKGQSRVAFVALDHNGSGALSFYTIFVAILSKDISCLCITKYIPFLCTAMAA